MTLQDADELCQTCAFAVLSAMCGMVIAIVMSEVFAWIRPG